MLEERLFWGKCLLFPGKLRKRETFERRSVYAFLFLLSGYPKHVGTRVMCSTGTAAISQAALSVTWVNIWTGSHLEWSVESLLPAAAAWHTPTTLGHSCCGGSHWHVSWGQTEVYPLPIACNSCCKLNLLGCHRKHKASSVSPDACLKKAARPLTHGSRSYYLLECFWFVGGKKRPLMYEVGLNSPEPNSPKVTHCFRVLYLRVGLGLDGAVFIFLLSAALLISEKNNQPICSMLRNKNKIISIFQMKAITKEQQWQPDGVRKSIQKTHCHLGSFY